MKTRILTLLVALAGITIGALPTVSFARNPLPPDTVFQGVKNDFPAKTVTSVEGTINLGLPSSTAPIGASIPTVVRKFLLGSPIVATTNQLVTSTNMINGAYTIVSGHGTLDVPRNVTVTATTVATGADTPGTITVTGTDITGAVISEVIVPAQGSTVAGVHAFKTVTSVVGAGWVIAGGNDTIVIGVGNLIGLPVCLANATGETLTILGTAVQASATTGSTTGVISLSTVDGSAGTYDGTKKLYVFCDK